MDGKAIVRPSNVAAVDETFRKAQKAIAKDGDQAALESQAGDFNSSRSQGL